MGVSMLGLGEAYVTIGLEGSFAFRERVDLGLGRLVRFVPNGGWDFVADFSEYEERVNPQTRIKDSDPYGLLATPGGVIVTDSGGEDVLWVARNGDISCLAVMPRLPIPPFTSGDAVPSSIAIGQDGAYYIGEVTGNPTIPGAATVYRLASSVPRDPCKLFPGANSGEQGANLQVYQTGFQAITGIAFDHVGNLYVLEYGTGLDPSAQPPGTGVLIRVAPDNVRTTILTGLDRPSGVAVGPDGAVYVSNHGVTNQMLFGLGEVLRIEPF
jgi:hypothetical protein